MILALFVTLLSSLAKPYSQPLDIIRVGAGSYTTRLPAKAKEPAAPYIVAGIHRPVPTNDWWSSLAFLKFSNQMIAHPLGLQAQENGLRLYCPGAGYTANPEGVFTAIMQPPEDLVIGHSKDLKFPDARVENWSDWFVTAAFGEHLHLTFGHGSPCVYGKIENGEPTITFGSPPAVVYGDSNSSTLGVSVGNRTYALFGPRGSHWDGIGSNRMVCMMAGKPYFSVALLPDSSPATFALFAKYAHNHVVDSKVSWTYNEKKSQVTTRYSFVTKNYEGTSHGTLFGLLPHQYLRSKDRLTQYTYQCARGTLKLGEGEGFTTVTPFQGVLPLLPTLGCDPKQLKRYLDADVATFKPETADTYWTGKSLGKLATLASIADATGNKSADSQFIQRLKALLEKFFTAEDKATPLFYYNKPWGTLIGYPASYGSDELLNDHHFHYGYFIRAAAEIARQDPKWAEKVKWGGMVELLIRDCASPDRNDPLFPFLRNFDLYEGHTWASGTADYGDGNNNESSSEAMNAWTGMILWGELTGDKKLRDTGIYLYVTEKDAIDTYWFNQHNLYPKAFTKPMASMIWGAKAVYATWFSGDPIHMHGINILPIQSGSLYLGTSPAYINQNIAGLEHERMAFDKKDTKRNQSLPPRTGQNWGGWGDIILMYQALGDPKAALTNVDFEKQEIEAGNSRANLYQWLHFLSEAGKVESSITADTALYGVFKNGNVLTYVIYNPTQKPFTVTFSDGKVIKTTRSGLVTQSGK